ncbi:GyrI-like domain-containing protein [Robiginitalea sp. SC105]|uniref:GyrI-like domain-containing protein n=1 Tax=Robiginitalea sp. SC105 TaxID=2762332 RepID=UPI001639534B|nr:GyrI-like domain-containing protein [Robiginitalea sp. SC105]MBC2837862.1 AraC family transcriptional regulator [Robiginitalea sp. SC105]
MKKVLLLAGLLIVLGATGYFFVYPHDYIVRYEAPSFPGTINQSIKIWNLEVGAKGTEIQQEDLLHLEQQIQAGDSVLRCRWEIQPLTASTSLVVAKFRDRDHSLANKWEVLFGNSTVERVSTQLVRDFAERLQAHTEEFEVEVVGEAELPSTFYAYVPLETSQQGKAAGMMNNYNLLSGILVNNGVRLNGPPMIVVNQWDREKDSLDYNFCFPIIRSTHLPENPLIQYKRIFPKRALKAIYHGNYITSDRAWYALMDYAEKNGIEVDPEPVEVFLNNPNMGGDVLRWTAEIYLPIKETGRAAGP